MSNVSESGGNGLFRTPQWNLAVSTLAFTICFAAWSLISPFAKSFKAEFNLSYTEALLLTAVPVVLGSLLRIPMGSLTDRYGGRLMFSVLLAFSAIPAVLFGYADTYWALIGTGFLLGVAGSSFAVGVPFVANWYPQERQGFAVGIYGMGNIGTAITFFAAPAIVDNWGRPGARLDRRRLPRRRRRADGADRARRVDAARRHPLPRGAQLRLAAVPPRLLLLHHLRRLRRAVPAAADRAPGLVRLLEGRGERACRRLRHRRDARASRRRLVRRPRGGVPGARARLRRDRDRRRRAGDGAPDRRASCR